MMANSWGPPRVSVLATPFSSGVQDVQRHGGTERGYGRMPLGMPQNIPFRMPLPTSDRAAVKRAVSLTDQVTLGGWVSRSA